jgi:hypothetical protein
VKVESGPNWWRTLKAYFGLLFLVVLLPLSPILLGCGIAYLVTH